MKRCVFSLIFVIIGGVLSPFSYGSLILSDLDDNGKVDFTDYAVLADHWGETDINSVGDISGPNGIADNAVDWYDLSAFSEDYLKAVFLMSSHKTDDEKLYIWESLDGKSWTLRGDNPVYENPNLPHTVFPPHYDNKQNVVRDPSIMEYNGKYYVVYTTNNLEGHYYGNQFGVASSDDLVNWTHIADVDVTGAGNFYYTWAPEWFVDTDGSVHVFISLNLSIYEIHPVNEEFTQWSVPVFVQGNWDSSRYMIDSFVIKIDDTYYLWYKGPMDPTYHNIEYATSTSLTSGYTVQGSGNWTNWNDGIGNIEGESLIKIDSDTWRIYFDDYVDGGIYYSESSDNFNTWTEKELITSESFIPAHPTVFRKK